jgi:hypothetical protein
VATKFAAMPQTCAYCEYFKFKPGNTEYGMAFCEHFKAFFPKQGIGNEPTGLRTCNHWVQKGTMEVEDDEN